MRIAIKTRDITPNPQIDILGKVLDIDVFGLGTEILNET
jgi:hypothetical protein